MSEKQSGESEKGGRSQCCCHQLSGEGQGMGNVAEG